MVCPGMFENSNFFHRLQTVKRVVLRLCLSCCAQTTYINYNMLNSTRILLVLSYDLLENSRTDDVIISNFISLLYKTNRFHVAVRLFSNRSQKTSKCGKNK